MCGVSSSTLLCFNIRLSEKFIFPGVKLIVCEWKDFFSNVLCITSVDVLLVLTHADQKSGVLLVVTLRFTSECAHRYKSKEAHRVQWVQVMLEKAGLTRQKLGLDPWPLWSPQRATSSLRVPTPSPSPEAAMSTQHV